MTLRQWLLSVLTISTLVIRCYIRVTNQVLQKDLVEITQAPSITIRTKKTPIVHDAWRETTRLLYRNSPHLEEWLEKPPLKLYIYDTLSEEFSIPAVSHCIHQKFNADNSNNCNWEPVVCNENASGTYPYYSLYRTNFNSDVVLLKRFLRYEHITKDPNEADLFIVPYPHKSHCLCRQKFHDKIMCPYSYQYIETEILQKLKYLTTHQSRHLFIFGSDWDLANPPLRRTTPLQLSLGPGNGCRKQGKDRNANCGSLVVPYVNTDIEYQPIHLAGIPESWWLDRPRHYGLAAIMGTPGHLHLRVSFFQNATAFLGDEIGGMPMYLSSSGNDRNLRRHDVAMEVYRNSTFCPILAGDDCGQKRFFDVILSGCIPVVLRYSSDEDDWPSWFHRNKCSIRRSYPFAQGTFYKDANAGIDYSTIVVEVDGDCGLTCIKPTLEELLRKPDKMRQLRRNLMGMAKLLTYGLDDDSFAYSDAFSALLVNLRHYAFHLK